MDYEVTFRGENRKIRRLGVSDIFELQRIVFDVINGATLRGVDLGLDSGDIEDTLVLEKLASVMLSGLDIAEQRILTFLKSLFVEPLPEGEEFYMAEIFDLIELLIDHPDVAAFLERARESVPQIAQKLAKKMGVKKAGKKKKATKLTPVKSS